MSFFRRPSLLRSSMGPMENPTFNLRSERQYGILFQGLRIWLSRQEHLFETLRTWVWILPCLKGTRWEVRSDIWSSLWPLQCVYTRVCVHTHKHTNTNIHTWFFLNFFETRSVFAFSTLNYIHYFSEARFPSATSAMFINRLQCCLFLCNKKLQVYQLKVLFSTISYLEVT